MCPVHHLFFYIILSNYKKGYDMVLFVKFFSLLKISEAIFYTPRKKRRKKIAKINVSVGRKGRFVSKVPINCQIFSKHFKSN